ncbi:MAG: adhesin, partial [Methanobrevibacter sp.]|nr:adhesin [Methanobrevibacter sp.]
INGNPLVNMSCLVAVNGPIYNVTTDEQGRFGVQINLARANTYTYALSFLGNDKYSASFNSTKLILTAKKTSITAKDKAFKASAKTKSFSVTLKTVKNPYDGKTYLNKGKKITLTVNGKTYSALTNAKGVAKFTIKLTKKGKYTAKVKFAGDKTYKASSKSVKITIN